MGDSTTTRKNNHNDEISKLYDYLKAFQGDLKQNLPNAELRKRAKKSKRLKKFLRGRKPIMMICGDGVIRVVQPGMDTELLGTNVIPLPVEYEDD